jgi:hypothetical protein
MLSKIKRQILIIKKMKFKIQRNSPLINYHNLINELNHLQEDFCKGKKSANNFSIDFIISRLNKIEHNEDEEDIFALKHL